MQHSHRTTSLDGARRLWTGRFSTVLSTHSRSEPGYPYGMDLRYGEHLLRIHFDQEALDRHDLIHAHLDTLN